MAAPLVDQLVAMLAALKAVLMVGLLDDLRVEILGLWMVGCWES